MKTSPFDEAIVVLTLICEASSESSSCRKKIFWTIRNRVLDPRFPKTFAAVCLQRFQFSEFNDDSGDNGNLLRVASMGHDDPAYIAALDDYEGALADDAFGRPDPTDGATHFYSSRGGKAPPYWAKPPARLTGQDGSVLFYRDVP